MIRRFFIYALVAAAAWTTTAAQNNSPYFGVRLGMDISAPTGNNNTYKVGSGFHVGGVYNIPITRTVYFEPGLMFFFNSMDSKGLMAYDKDFYYQGAAKYYGLRVPFNFGYRLSLLPDLDMAISTGPWVNINLSGRRSLMPNFDAPIPVPDATINLLKNGAKRVEALWGFGLSFTFAQSYYIGLSGGVAFTPLASYGNKDKKIKVHRNMVAITLGYNF